MRFRCTFSHFSRCIHFPKLLKKATFSHLKGICSQKRMLGHKPNNLQGHLSLLEPLLLCALAQNSQHLPATTAVNLLRSLGRSSSWILLASPLVSSFFLYDRNGILKFYNWTDGLHHMYMMIGWKDERTKAYQSYIPEQKIWCCTMLSWSCFVSCHGRWLLPFLARVLAQLQRTIHLLWIHGSIPLRHIKTMTIIMPANIHP